VIEAFKANDALMVIADWTDNNWVIAEFLHAVKQPNIPYYLFIPGNPTKETIALRALIQPQQFIDAINTVGG
jgi:thiol:disulfide interchange protein